MREKQILLPEESLMPSFRMSPPTLAGIKRNFFLLHTAVRVADTAARAWILAEFRPKTSPVPGGSLLHWIDPVPDTFLRLQSLDLFDIGGAESGRTRMREIELLVEAYLMAEGDLALLSMAPAVVSRCRTAEPSPWVASSSMPCSTDSASVHG